MLQRLYAHNFRCYENFEFSPKSDSSALLIGRNGTGKSTLASVLEIFQKIGRRVSSVENLVTIQDFSPGAPAGPMRFELEVYIEKKSFIYSLAFEFREKFKDVRVLEESLRVDGDLSFSRKIAEVTLYSDVKRTTQFGVDWYQVALPVIHERSEKDHLYIFRKWLGQMVILSPLPPLMTGDSSSETLQPVKSGNNFADWLAGLLGQYPAAYSIIFEFLKDILYGIRDFRNEVVGSENKRLLVNFSHDEKTVTLRFGDLSDGEKCFFVVSTLIAANKSYGPIFCFWDEPDNYLSPHEVGHVIMALRRSFVNSGQIFMTTHNEEAILKFSDESTYVFGRKSHLEPTRVRKLSDLRADKKLDGDLVRAFIAGDLDI